MELPMGQDSPETKAPQLRLVYLTFMYKAEIAPELTGHGLPLVKCEAYNRVYDQPYGSS
jgi:hypothetical protein